MATKYINPHNQQALVEGGLTPAQASLYECLVQRGSLPASRASFFAGISRTLGYKVLSELEGMGLVVKTERPKSVAKFSAAHPLKLKDLADKRLEGAKDAKFALEGTLSKLISDFNTVAGQPGVRILEGIKGISELYEDQLNEGQPLKLIRSVRDRDQAGLEELISKQMHDRTQLGIPTRAITPMVRGAPYRIIAKDQEYLVERRIVPAEALSLPAQIFIYANKVALTSYDDQIITTIIENTAIRQTFEILFDYIWHMAEPQHQEILKTLIGEG